MFSILVFLAIFIYQKLSGKADSPRINHEINSSVSLDQFMDDLRKTKTSQPVLVPSSALYSKSDIGQHDDRLRMLDEL